MLMHEGRLIAVSIAPDYLKMGLNEPCPTAPKQRMGQLSQRIGVEVLSTGGWWVWPSREKPTTLERETADVVSQLVAIGQNGREKYWRLFFGQ